MAQVPNPLRILLLEDDADLADMLVRFFEGHGVEVARATDGQAAWDLLQAAHPHVILTDLMVPGLSGAEFCGMVRGDPALASIPIIAMSASMSTDEQAGEMQVILGADLAVPKPLQLQALLGTIQRLATDGRPASAPA